jgi:hypothetical protein
MSIDNYKQVLFNDGQGLTHTDLNDLTRFLESKIWDQILHSLIGNTTYTAFNGTNGRDPCFGGQDGTDHASNLAYCLTPGAAYLRQGSSTAKIQIAPGTLLQKVGTLDGNDPKLIAFTFAGTEEFTLTSGDATNPRVDLLQMKLEYVNADSQSRDFEDAATRVVTSTAMNVKRRVQCTISVKIGTPAASPTIPDPDSGYVPVGYALVGATWNAAGSDKPSFGQIGEIALGAHVTIADLRMPIRVKGYTIDPSTFKLITAFALAGNERRATSSNATNELQAFCPLTEGRIFAIGLRSLNSHATFVNTLGHHATGGTSFDSRNGVPNMTSVNDDGLHITPYYLFTHSPGGAGGGPTIQASAVNKINVPIWCSGERCPAESVFTLGNSVWSTNLQTASYGQLALKIATGANGTELGPITFYIAEGI